MSSYERGLNQPTLINCVHEGLLAAIIMINISQINSSYGKNNEKKNTKLFEIFFEFI